MKRNMLETMNRLKIDEGIRDLIRQLWKHNYRTNFSCEGHGRGRAYVTFKGEGDGWFEERSSDYNFVRVENGNCCEDGPTANFCGRCGAGKNGNTKYSAI